MSDPSDLSGNQIVLDHTYRVGEVVHRDAMATLYQALWDPFEIPVHIRSYESLIKLRLRHRDTTRIKRNIVDRAGRVRGPHLPDTIDVGEEDATRPFLVMRLPEGRLLLNRLREDGPLPPEEVAHILEGVVAALEQCRAAEMPHRGPLPNRIWLGDDGSVVLLGIGEVLYRDDTISMAGLATTELVWHIPPESFARSMENRTPPAEPAEDADRSTRLRIEPEGNLQGRELEDDPRAEVYTLGCLAYHCLNGHHPFFLHKGDPSEGIVGTLKDTPLDLKRFGPDTDVSELVFSALSRDRARRPATPAEFAARFADAVNISLEQEEEERDKKTRKGRADRSLDEDGVHPGELRAAHQSVILWRSSAVILAIALIAYAALQYLRPHSIMITSESPSLQLAEVVGHTSEPLGTVPIILERRSLQTPIELQVVAPNGDLGPPQRFIPRNFTDLGRCRQIDIELEFPE